MKKIYSFFLLIMCVVYATAQSPQKMSYQAVIRNSGNNLVINTIIGMQISILQGSSTGTVVFVETHMPTTNASGLVSLEIGTGTNVTGTFGTIDWSSGPYFLQTETDPEGGTSYTITGTSQLLSVPYALYAENANYTETDPVFEASDVKDVTTADIESWDNKSDFDGEYNSLDDLPTWSDSLDVHIANIIFPTTFQDSEFRIVNSAGIAGNPDTSPSVSLAGVGPGNLENGDYDYVVTYLTVAGETGASPASGVITVSDNTSDGEILITDIAKSVEGSVYARNIYRRFNSIGDYYYVATIGDNSNTTYFDNKDNASLGGALSISNSTTTSIQFLASGLSGNRIYTMPDVSGQLVIDSGNVGVNQKAERSLVSNGRSVVNQLQNGSYSLSSGGGEWAEAYIDSDGRLNSTGTSNPNVKQPIFGSNMAIGLYPENPYDEDSRQNGTIDVSKWDNTLFVADVEATVTHEIENNTFKLYANGDKDKNASVTQTSIAESILDSSKDYFIAGRHSTATLDDALAYVNVYFGTVAVYSIFTASNVFPAVDGSFLIHVRFDGANWEYANILSTSVYTDFAPTDAEFKFSVLSDPGGGEGDDAFSTLWIYYCGSGFGEAYINHIIESGTFSSTLDSVIGVPLKSSWENGSDIKFKLLNSSGDDSGWLEADALVTIDSFSSEPENVIIKLTPKENDPTPGIPSLFGFYITEL